MIPCLLQFPFDGVCEQIVRELEKRNWRVPGITVKFHGGSNGGERSDNIHYIRGEEFSLLFERYRENALDSSHRGIAGVSGLVIPRKELHVRDDESHLDYYLYIGNDWERDRERFIKCLLVTAKADGNMYLPYRGGCTCTETEGVTLEETSIVRTMLADDAENLPCVPHTHPGVRPPLLFFDSYLGRERRSGEPDALRTADVMEEFTAWLNGKVLPYIASRPIPIRRIDDSPNTGKGRKGAPHAPITERPSTIPS